MIGALHDMDRLVRTRRAIIQVVTHSLAARVATDDDLDRLRQIGFGHVVRDSEDMLLQRVWEGYR